MGFNASLWGLGWQAPSSPERGAPGRQTKLRNVNSRVSVTLGPCCSIRPPPSEDCGQGESRRAPLASSLKCWAKCQACNDRSTNDHY